MSRRLPVFALAPIALAWVLAAAVAGPGVASAAQRLEDIPLPSTLGNIPANVRLNRVTSLRATVMLPDGYDEQPGRRWPVLYLLQGIGDHADSWAFPGTGDLPALAQGFPGIVVMPEGGRGFFLDWWRGGARSGPNWMRYYLDEVIPTAESRYRILPGRANHAIGGVSMGGYGALLIAGQLPGYFGSVVSMSGLIDSQARENYLLMPSQIGARSYDSVWGPLTGPYAAANNPMRTAASLRDTRVYLSVGDGRADPRVPFKLAAWTVGSWIERAARGQNRRYDSVLTRLGVPHVLALRRGVHDWPYWRRELPQALAWNVFAPPPVTGVATSWTYTTMQPHGNAWGLGYRFASPTRALETFTRDGQTLTATGAGRVTITPGAAEADASGQGTRPDCTFTADLPFTRELPPGCGAPTGHRPGMPIQSGPCPPETAFRAQFLRTPSCPEPDQAGPQAPPQTSETPLGAAQPEDPTPRAGAPSPPRPHMPHRENADRSRAASPELSAPTPRARRRRGGSRSGSLSPQRPFEECGLGP